MMTLEPVIGVRKNGPSLVFGQTYVVAVVLLVLLYPACLWYRGFKVAHPQSLLKYL